MNGYMIHPINTNNKDMKEKKRKSEIEKKAKNK